MPPCIARCYTTRNAHWNAGSGRAPCSGTSLGTGHGHAQALFCGETLARGLHAQPIPQFGGVSVGNSACTAARSRGESRGDPECGTPTAIHCSCSTRASGHALTGFSAHGHEGMLSLNGGKLSNTAALHCLLALGISSNAAKSIQECSIRHCNDDPQRSLSSALARIGNDKPQDDAYTGHKTMPTMDTS